jgi:type I restriction enzyme R subunit
MARLTESVIEDAALAWLESLGWQIVHGPDFAPDMLGAERTITGRSSSSNGYVTR